MFHNSPSEAETRCRILVILILILRILCCFILGSKVQSLGSQRIDLLLRGCSFKDVLFGDWRSTVLRIAPSANHLTSDCSSRTMPIISRLKVPLVKKKATSKTNKNSFFLTVESTYGSTHINMRHTHTLKACCGLSLSSVKNNNLPKTKMN